MDLSWELHWYKLTEMKLLQLITKAAQFIHL